MLISTVIFETHFHKNSNSQRRAHMHNTVTNTHVQYICRHTYICTRRYIYIYLYTHIHIYTYIQVHLPVATIPADGEPWRSPRVWGSMKGGHRRQVWLLPIVCLCIYVCVYVCVCVCLYIWMCIYVWLYMYIYMCLCMRLDALSLFFHSMVAFLFVFCLPSSYPTFLAASSPMWMGDHIWQLADSSLREKVVTIRRVKMNFRMRIF